MDIKKFERSIIQPTLMLDFINESEKRYSNKKRDIFTSVILGILIALIIVQ